MSHRLGKSSKSRFVVQKLTKCCLLRRAFIVPCISSFGKSFGRLNVRKDVNNRLGKIVHILYGEEGTGKTTAAMGIMAGFQRETISKRLRALMVTGESGDYVEHVGQLLAGTKRVSPTRLANCIIDALKVPTYKHPSLLILDDFNHFGDKELEFFNAINNASNAQNIVVIIMTSDLHVANMMLQQNNWVRVRAYPDSTDIGQHEKPKKLTLEDSRVIRANPTWNSMLWSKELAGEAVKKRRPKHKAYTVEGMKKRLEIVNMQDSWNAKDLFDRFVEMDALTPPDVHLLELYSTYSDLDEEVGCGFVEMETMKCMP